MLQSELALGKNLLLDDLSVTLLELVKVILHHVDFADLLCDCMIVKKSKSQYTT